MAYDNMPELWTWSLNGKKKSNISLLQKNLKWSGNYKNCCREISFDVMKEALADLGGAAGLYADGNTLFSGYIFERTRDNSDPFFSCVAYDNGIYLKNNTAILSVSGQTPEEVTRQLCQDHGISVGSIASTGISLSRNFIGTGIYQIIQTLYTLASDETGDKYHIRFDGEKLNVMVKSSGGAALRLVPGSNLLSCSSRDSITDMINSVAVYDDNYNRTATYDNSDGYKDLYGLMQKAIKASSYDDPEKTAKQLLEDNGISTTIKAHCIGNYKLVSGNTVVVHEPVTNVDGVFWIQSDSHSWQRGIYRTDVELDFRNLMDKQTAGSVPKE